MNTVTQKGIEMHNFKQKQQFRLILTFSFFLKNSQLFFVFY